MRLRSVGTGTIQSFSLFCRGSGLARNRQDSGLSGSKRIRSFGLFCRDSGLAKEIGRTPVYRVGTILSFVLIGETQVCQSYGRTPVCKDWNDPVVQSNLSRLRSDKDNRWNSMFIVPDRSVDWSC
uniref:(northern house mosquito) hypothetical protein n=1 Tax=Culex pipiens TaxID=7175 RepID=A0A8D8CNR2_CULPI